MLQLGIRYYFFNDGLNELVSLGYNKGDIMAVLNQGKYDTRWESVLSARDFNNLTGNYFGISLGASGAIYGIMVAFAFMFPNMEIMLLLLPIPIKAKYFVGALIALDLYLGVKGQSLFGSTGGVGHFAHIGGAALGYFMMWYWKKKPV